MNKYYRNAVIISLMMFGMAVVLHGCQRHYQLPSGQSLPPTLGYATETLEASKALYNTVLSTAGQLHCDGKISDETALKIIKIANIYYLSHQSAQSALSAWYQAYVEKTEDPENYRGMVQSAFLQLTQDALRLAGDYQELTGKDLPIPAELTAQAIKALFGGE